MLPTKIVVIGAGSASFGLNTLSTLMDNPRLRGSHLALVDHDPHNLDLIARLAQRLNQDWGSQMQVSAHTHHQCALENANFVVLSIEVAPREALWRSDYEIPLKYGVRQPYAENGGPGGFIHAARNIGPVMDIVQAMEKICPQAWLINFTNPMTRICDAISRYSSIKVVGLCHQILVGYALVGMTLAEDLGIEVPPGITTSHADPVQSPLRKRVAVQAMDKIHIQAAGINHFTWMLSVHDRRSGQDLYPLFAQRWAAMNPSFEPLSRRIYDIFELFPIPGDEHLCEYLPWISNPLTQPWEKFDLSLYAWDTWDQLRSQGYTHIADLAAKHTSLDPLRGALSEGAVEIIENIAGAGSHYHLAANLPNTGQINNLPNGSIVETPGLVTGAGVQPVHMGRLPDAVAELCRRELLVGQLCVDAAVHGDRGKALQCLLLDPVITDIDQAEKILGDYLGAYRKHLAQFWQ